MPGKGKKFISKKNATTYRLVRCSQSDADGDPSGHIFVRVDEMKHEKFSMKLPPCESQPSPKEILNQKKQVPPDGSQSELDPDIAAALDDDDLNPEDIESVLEDDFVTMANGGIQASNKLENSSENEDNDDEFLVSDDEDEESFDYDIDKEKLDPTKYSLTATVKDCDENVKIINERFQRFCGTYDDDQIGSLEFEEIEGSHKPDKGTLEDLVEDSVEYKKELCSYESNIDDDLKHKIQQYAEASSDEISSEEEEDEEPTKYDCESIISTYSNKQNRPSVIKAEKKEKEQIPANLWKQTLTKSNLRQMDREGGIKEEIVESATSKNKDIIFGSWNGRQKNETAEEKRLRKQAHKQHKRDSRIIKKENKLAFKEEKKRAIAVVLNTNRNKFVSLC